MSSPPRTREARFPLPLKWEGFPGVGGGVGGVGGMGRLGSGVPSSSLVGARTIPTRLWAHLQVCVLSSGSKTKFSWGRDGWPKVKLPR